jgi:hypothetical protein
MGFIRQTGYACIELGKFAVQRGAVQGLLHRRVRMPEKLLQQVTAQRL